MNRYFLNVSKGCSLIELEVSRDVYDSFPWFGYLCVTSFYKGVDYEELPNDLKKLIN